MNQRHKDKVNIGAYVPLSLAAQCRAVSKASGFTVSDIIVDALSDWLLKWPQPKVAASREARRAGGGSGT